MKKILLFLVVTIFSSFLTCYAKDYYTYGFGIVPKYVKGETNLTVTDVIKDSSADKNNLKDGDVIVKINDKSISEINDADLFSYMFLSQELNIVKKDGKAISVIADTKVSPATKKSTSYLVKSLKYFNKEKMKGKDILKGFKYLSFAIDTEPNNLLYRKIRISILEECVKQSKDIATVLIDTLIEDYNKLYEIVGDPHVYYQIAQAHLLVDDSAKAEEYYNKVIEQIPTNDMRKQVYEDLANYYYDNSFEECVKYYNKLLPLVNNKEKEKILTIIANKYKDLNDMTNAVLYYNKILPLVDNNKKMSIFLVIADKYKSNDDIANAITYYNKFINLCNSTEKKLSIYATIAVYYANHNNTSKSVEYWTKFITNSKSNKDKIIGYQNIVDLYKKNQKNELAFKNAQQILNLNSKDIYAINFMYEYYSAKQQYAQTIPYITKLIYLEPSREAEYYLLRSIMYDKINKLGSAYADVQKAFTMMDNSNQYKQLAVQHLVFVSEKRISNSLKGYKNYVKEPSWFKIAPASYVYAIGYENSLAQYWANRRASFYTEINNGITKYTGDNLVKCYTDIMNSEDTKNREYSNAIASIRYEQQKQLDYVRARAIMSEQYANQSRLQQQLINGLYAVQTAPQTYNVKVQHSGNLDVNYYGTMNHYIRY